MNAAPVERQIRVSSDPRSAYHLFVDDIGAWWPLAGFSCFGDGGSAAFDGSRFVETGPSGETAVWGTITHADPPRSVSFTWHPGSGPQLATQVTVTFTPTDDPQVTLVTLVHSGWEVLDDPSGTRAQYDKGWITVLDQFAATA